MDNDDDILERKILEHYFEILALRQIPTSGEVLKKVQYDLEVSCMDLVYGKGILEVKEEFIYDVLSKYKHIHYYSGTLCYDARNVLIPEWSEKTILLLT